MYTLWSMFHNGRFVMDIPFCSIEDRLLRVHENKFITFDGVTEYYRFGEHEDS